MNDLGFRGKVDTADLRRPYLAAQENAEFQKALLRAHKEVAGFAREHDRVVRRVDALITEGDGRLAYAFPCLPQIVGEILREGGFRGGPAVVRLVFLDPLLAVVALP